VDTTKTITHVSLCAGYGGIDLGLSRAIPNLRTIAFSEIEAFACANLVAKMEAGLLDAAPIWTNLKTFPWSEFRDRVDILSGGYPCQPFSAAGKRLGKDDPRHLWPWIADGIRAMRPRICFFENVEGHINLGLREVISELEGIGYKAAWGIFSAREVGAPHQRKRVFILAYDQRQRIEELGRQIAVGSQLDSVGNAQPRWVETWRTDGSDRWMDYAELYTTCDNRTDELRLLGNGVVPATAERAFRTLLEELQ
jgi:DNA (cytosine-5)-methyltransferase 1